MGAACSDDRQKYAGYSFTDDELTRMKEIFTQISKAKSKSASRKTLSKVGLKKHLPENQEFAVKLYNWMRALSENDAINFDAYVSTVQVLAKNLDNYNLLQYRDGKMEKFEIFLQISLGKINTPRENLPSTKISITQALIFFQEICNIFNSGNNTVDPNNPSYLASKVITNNLFRTEQTVVEWKDLVKYVKEDFPQINKIIQSYFYNKFINPNNKINIPVLSNNLYGSHILNNDILPLFCLSDSTFQALPKVNLLYSSATQGKDFHKVANAIKGNQAPIIVIVKHEEGRKEGQDSTQKPNSYVCGAMIKVPWRNNVRYGNSETTLFSLVPRFRLFSVVNKSAETKNFVYLNAESHSRTGLGFGGIDYKGFKLWIDEKIDTDSYTKENDGVYESGSLLEPYITKLNIAQIEVWGADGENRMSVQETPRQTAGVETRGSYGNGSYIVEKNVIVEKSYVVDGTGSTILEREKKSYVTPDLYTSTADIYTSPERRSYNADIYVSPDRNGSYLSSSRPTDYSTSNYNTNVVTTTTTNTYTATY